MTKISKKLAYPNKNPISDNDYVVGTNGDTQKLETKSFQVSDFRNYLIAGLSPETGGTLKVTEIVYEGELTTPEEVANQLNPSHIVQRYEVLILNVNGDKYQLKLQNVVIGILQDPITSDDFIPISLVAENLSETISFYKGFNSETGREEFYSIGSVGFSITKELDEDEVETGRILLEQTNETNLGGGINIYKGFNPATKKQEYYTLYSSDESVTFVKELDEDEVETGRISVVSSQADTNFAKDDLTFTANRTHNLDSKTVYYNNAKQIKSNVNVIQPTGEASYEEKGFGELVSDIIKRIKNGAGNNILELRGDLSAKFFGNLWSNGISGDISNTIFGENAFINATTGEDNVVVGFGAMQNSTTARANVAVGLNTLNENTTGDDNTALGIGVFTSLKTGIQNTGIGSSAGGKLDTDSSYNTAIGTNSLLSDLVGDDVVHATNCISIGVDTKSSSTSPVNEIIIGNTAKGEGNNTVVIGNEDSEYIHIPRHTTTEINSFTGMTKGAIVFNTTLNTICFYNGTTWRKVTDSAM